MADVYTHKLFSSRAKVNVTDFVGEVGRIFYNEQTGELRLSDGVTPYGLPIYTGGGGSTLYLYNENARPVHPPIANYPVSIALGDGSVSRTHGALTYAAGAFSHPGDAQIGTYIARGITTNGGPTEIYLDSVSKQLLIPQQTSISYTINIIARRTDSFSNEGAVYEVRGGIDRSSTLVSTRMIGTSSKITISEDNPVWDVNVSADTTTGALRLVVSGEYGKTIRWVAHIQTVEVTV